MSTVAAAAKAKSAVKTEPVIEAKPEQKLRQVRPKQFGPSSLQSIGHDYDWLAVMVPGDWSFADVMNPRAWVNVCTMVSRDALNTRRDKIGSLIYARSPKFLAFLEITGIVLDHLGNPAGLNVECIGPVTDPKTGEARPINRKTRKAWYDEPQES